MSPNGRAVLGQKDVPQLLRQFAVPSIIAMIVGALYNIVDQFFIGQKVGELGNAATNISFPLSITCVAISLLFGIGGSSAFSLMMGEGDHENAVKHMANAIILLLIGGCTLLAVTRIFLDPMLHFFGSPDSVMNYARTYTGIVSFGFPFLIIATGGGHLIRADGRPRISMACNLTGAVINTVLDAAFVFGLNMGMAGAASATVIGQIASASMAVYFLSHCKSVKIKRQHLRLSGERVKRICSLGTAPCVNQFSMMIVQITMNNSMNHYGALSVYGSSIPIACAGIISKVNMVFMAFIIGIAQGLQPIAGFNYGAKKYDRVKKALRLALTCGFFLALAAFLMFQLLPRQIISIFGGGSEEYFNFAISYFRIYLFCTWLNFLQPIISNFFTAIGKPKSGALLSLTRQIILLLPLILILPLFFGIEGIMFAGPIADGTAAAIAVIMITKEMKRMPGRMGRR